MSARRRVGGLAGYGTGRGTAGVADGVRAGVAHGAQGDVYGAQGDAPPGEAEVPVLLDVLAAACGAGVSLPRALTATGTATGGERGAALERAGTALVLGASWAEAWAGASVQLGPVVRALRPAWEEGARPADGLRSTAESVRREQHARALDAAGRLGVRLVLPLGLCYLPAFVLVGLVPVLMSMAGRALGG